jgi:hypothetical protein
MEKTCDNVPLWNILTKRKTFFTPQNRDEDDNNDGDHNNKSESTPLNVLSRRSSLVFNSENRIGSASRRSVYDISVNLLELNCKAMRKSILEKPKENDENRPETVKDDHRMKNVKDNIDLTQKFADPIVRKRKLFSGGASPDDSFACKENLVGQVDKKLKSIDVSMRLNNDKDVSIKTSVFGSAKLDRRKTVSYFKPKKVDDTKTRSKMTPLKATQKYIVCTNMSSSDKQSFQAVSRKCPLTKYQN